MGDNSHLDLIIFNMELMLTYCNCKIPSIEIQDLKVLKLHIFFIQSKPIVKVASTNLKVYIHESLLYYIVANHSFESTS